jgi:hypothetical protein
MVAGFLQAQRAQADDRLPFGPEVRRPLGVYAHFDIEDLISAAPAGTTDMHAYLRETYAGLLSDPAVTGVTVGQHWDNIQISDPRCVFTHSCAGGPNGYDWSYLDDAFAEARAAHKTVQLIITPGVDSPSWLLAKIPACDGLFSANASVVAMDCGTFQFVGIPEQARSDHPNPVFPLPWNPVYKAAWWDFLAHLSARYNSNPSLVAVELGGPTGASVEIILPTTANETQLQVNGLGADDVWSVLIQHAFPGNAAYQNSDQVFIDEWNQATGVYQALFSGLTLILSPDAGDALPEFKKQNPVVAPPPPAAVPLFEQDCSQAIAGTRNDLRSCEAKSEIISNFINSWGVNAKSTEVGGMTASSPAATGDINVPGIKLLTVLVPPRYSILAGAQFDHRVSNLSDNEGCTVAEGAPCSVTIEEAGYNVLGIFFATTPAAQDFGAVGGSERVEYLEVPPQDIQYAQDPANACPSPGSALLGETSLQDLLNRANHDLLALSGHWTPLASPTCP